MDEILKRDQNHITVLAGITNDSDQDITMLRVDPITKRLLISATGGGSSSLIVGTTIITGGTNGYFLYDNNGVLGEIVPSGTGTVTNVATGTGLTGGPITTTGTISLANTAVTPASYTNANITVDQQGRITAASNGSSGSPGGLNTQLQYNNSSSFGGITGATTNGTIVSLTNPLLGGATITTSTVNGVTLTTGGGTTTFLNANGAYSTPAGSGGLTVGTTTITSGTNTRVLFDNAGVLGEYTISGTGSVAMTTSPTFVTPTLGAAAYTTLSGGNITDSALTAGRVTFAGTAGILKDDSTLTYATSGGLIVSNKYAKFGTATVPLPETNGVDFYYTDNTTAGAQIGVGNTSNGSSAYTGMYLNNDLAVDGLVDHFGFWGLNSSTYSDTTFGTAFATPSLMFLQNTDAPIAYMAVNNSGAHIFYIGNTVVGGIATVNANNEIARINTVGIGVHTTNPLTGFENAETNTSAVRGILTGQYSTGTTSSLMITRKARGTLTSPTTIVTGDNLGSWVSEGYDGTGYLQMARIITQSEGTIGTNRIPTNMRFQTATNAATSVLTTAMTINSSQVVTLGTTGTTQGTLAFAGATSGLVTMMGAAAAGTWTMTLPITAGTSGYSLTTDGAGNTTWTNVSGGGSGITIGTTTITSGTNTRILYDDSGVVGESAGFTFGKTTGVFTLAPAVRTTGSPNILVVTSPADTTLTASTESTDANFNLSATRQFATGTLAQQRAMLIQAPTYAFVGASTVTKASTLQIGGAPVAGTNATITSSSALSFGAAPKANATSAMINLSDTALSSGNSNGTYIGGNPAAFTGDFLKFQVANTSVLKVDSSGAMTMAGSAGTWFNAASTGVLFSPTGSHPGGASLLTLSTSSNFDDTGAITDNMFKITGVWAPTSSTATFNGELINSTINQTSTATGITRGLVITPVLTSAFDYRAFEITAATYNLLSTTTLAQQQTAVIGQYTLANASSQTVTAAASLRIVGAPIQGTNVTLTNTYALQIDAGAAYFGGTMRIPTGGAAAIAGTGTLTGGTVTINTTAVTANSLVFLTDTASSVTNVGTLTVSSKSAGTSFTVTSTLALDTSTFNWFIIN